MAHGRYLPTLKETIQMALTFVLAVMGWIIFRAESMTQAVDYFYCMFTHPVFGDKTFVSWALAGFLLLLVEWLQRDKQHALQFPIIKPFNYVAVRWFVYCLIIVLIAVYSDKATNLTFIYFQF